nr:transglycosylase domain-containing protein [Nitrosomonas nitrosa]
MDWRSVLRDFIRMVTFRRFGGSSTIEMQFVRTCTGYRQRTIRRKVYEMLLASLLQYRASKIQILKSYMAVVYLGHGVRGAQVAAAMLFSKRQLEQLTVAEACHIAAMMVYPMPKVPTERWRARVDRRANYALSLLAKIKLPH